MLDVPRELILFVSSLLAARRRSIGTRKNTRRLGCYRQALFGLAWFRDKADIRRLGAGFGLPQSTACRYLAEVTDVLAERAPGLREALERAVAEGTPYVILDGKIVDADRCHEKTLSRAVISAFTGQLPCLADGGYEGAGHGILTPVKKPKGNKELDISTRTYNALLRSLRCMGERGFALLTQRWHTLQHVTMSPGKIGQIARAALVLTLFEHKMLARKSPRNLIG
jgi:DDE superfamily endonuclease